jgi:hypothetical protein
MQPISNNNNQTRRAMRTLEEAKSYLNYHSPDADALPRHEAVNTAFQQLIEAIWKFIPDGPGKTVAVRAIGTARMQCNSAIANKGN